MRPDEAFNRRRWGYVQLAISIGPAVGFLVYAMSNYDVMTGFAWSKTVSIGATASVVTAILSIVESARQRRVIRLWLARDAETVVQVTHRTNRELALPPGSRVRTVLDFLCSRKALERIYEPILADMQQEWMEAIAAGRTKKAFWIRIRGYISLLRAGGLHSVVKIVAEMWGKFSGP